MKTIIDIERIPIREICDSYATEDGVFLTDENMSDYIESIKADESSNEWADLDGGYLYRFTVIGHDQDSFLVREWLSDSPLRELCPDILPDVAVMMGDRCHVMSLWETVFHGHRDYWGEYDADLEIDVLGELDMAQLQVMNKIEMPQ